MWLGLVAATVTGCNSGGGDNEKRDPLAVSVRR